MKNCQSTDLNGDICHKHQRDKKIKMNCDVFNIYVEQKDLERQVKSLFQDEFHKIRSTDIIRLCKVWETFIRSEEGVHELGPTDKQTMS